ncbi:MAG: ATP-binding cassette domain-containing protein [Pseudomonadota bacterium]
MTPLITLQDIHLTFGSTPLLEGADLSIEAHQRLCVVGRNGSGKSTLLKIAAGMVESDTGTRFVQPGTTIRYLPQEPDLSEFDTVSDYIDAGLGPSDDHHAATLMLNELGLTGTENPSRLSGGELRRAALVRTLAAQPDILLLDEPTNHLDLPAIVWLEKRLGRTRSALVLISHDRAFLKALSRTTLWVDRGKTRLLNKGFDAFEDWRDSVLEQEELDRHKLDRKIVREDHWVTHGVSGRRKRNVRRLKELAGLRKARTEQRSLPQNVDITVAEAATSGKQVLVAKEISKSIGERRIVSKLSLKVNRGDRLGIVGPNGAGKTTLLRVLMGDLEPDAGAVKLGLNLEPLIIDQKRESLDLEMPLRDALTDGGDLVAIGDQRKHVMAYMKDFLFLPEQARTPIHALSGGEKGRLQLARGLRTPSNFLVLDEPTNDLDLETLDLLQEMISDYEGTVIIVSHDRDFLDRTTTSILAPEGNGRWLEYAGGYSDMLAQRGSAPVDEKNRSKPSTTQATPKFESSKSTEKSGKLSFKDKHALETLPAEIEKLAGEIDKLNRVLAAPGLYETDPKQFEKLMAALTQRQSRHDAAEERWLELEILREELEGG